MDIVIYLSNGDTLSFANISYWKISNGWIQVIHQDNSKSFYNERLVIGVNEVRS